MTEPHPNTSAQNALKELEKIIYDYYPEPNNTEYKNGLTAAFAHVMFHIAELKAKYRVDE